MAQKQVIWPFFLIALFFSLSSLAPLCTFAPFIAMAYYRYSFNVCIWLSALCGLILDLLCSTSFGIYTLNFTLVNVLLYRYRIYFVEKPIGLASLTFIFSILFSMTTRLFFFLYGIALPLTFKSMVTDFLLMPLIDAVYSLLCFSCPLILYRLARRQWFLFLFFKKETKKKKEERLKADAK